MKSVAIIGGGPWARILAKSFSQKCNISHVVTTGNTGNLLAMKSIIPDARITDLKTVLEDNDIESVVIAAPIESLARLGCECLTAGKHVFLEKPGAQRPEEISSLQEVRSSLVCMIDYLHLADPKYHDTKLRVANQACKISFVWRKLGSFNNDILLNLVSHDIAMVIDMFGNNEIKNLDIESLEKDFCKLHYDYGGHPITVDIDRCSPIGAKRVLFKGPAVELTWSPNPKALDFQRDLFLRNVQQNTGFSNLDLAKEVLSIIEGIRQ